jgi:ion channel-forming bestrophin family protein
VPTIEKNSLKGHHQAVIDASLRQQQSDYIAEDVANTPGLRNTASMWLRPFTRLHRIPVVKRVWLYLALLAAYTVLIDVCAGSSYPAKLFKDAGTAGTYGGIVLGLLLVFRTNSAYERWWEGRKLWGQLTNESRNFALKVNALLTLTPAHHRRVGELLISFAYALKHHLRDTKPTEPLPGVGDASTLDQKHLPLHIADQIYALLADWHQRKLIDSTMFLALDHHARPLMDICGSCERIKTSPIAVSYRAFMRQGIALNLLAWPWYMTSEYNWWWSLPPILIGAYFLIGIELIAEDIEDPFGSDGDDLPLDNICSNIKKSVSSIMDIQRNQKFTISIEKPNLDLLRDPL